MNPGSMGMLGALLAVLTHWSHHGHALDYDRRRTIATALSIPIGALGIAALLVAVATR